MNLGGELKQLIECKLSDTKPHRALARLAEQFPDAEAAQIVYNLRQEMELQSRMRRPGLRIWQPELAFASPFQ